MGKEKKARLLTMDELQNRPCEVNGTPALFHRWVEEARPVVRPAAFRFVEVIHETFALVEYQDGTIGKVKPEAVRFPVKED